MENNHGAKRKILIKSNQLVGELKLNLRIIQKTTKSRFSNNLNKQRKNHGDKTNNNNPKDYKSLTLTTNFKKNEMIRIIIKKV